MVQNNTDGQFNEIINQCRDIFIKKTADYGTSWRVYRPISVADQLYIKAKRARNLQEGSVPKVKEEEGDEFRGMINYSVIGLMQLRIEHDEWSLPVEEVLNLYNNIIIEATDLMHRKSHDYGSAWRDMSVKSITDLILAKILRVRQIAENEGKTVASEGIDSNYFDILIYAVFALILTDEQKK